MTNPEVASADATVPKTAASQPAGDQNAAVGKSAFLEKVQDIPVVHAAKELGTAAYNQVKLSNSFANMTLSKAESTVLYLALSAKPFLDIIHPQAKLVDDLAVRGLEVVESKAPYILKTPEQMVEDARKLCASTVQTGYQKVDEVKNLGTGALSSVKNYGLQKASDCLSGTEKLVDRYLPPALGEGSQKNAEGDNPSVSERATNLTTKVGQRVYGHGVQQFIHMQKFSQDSVARLAQTVQLLQYVKENYTGKTVQEYVDEAKVQASWIWEELNKEPAAASEADKSLEQRMLSLARRITSGLVHTYTAVPLAGLPQTCLDGARSASSYAVELFTQFDQALNSGEIASALLQKALGTISSLEGAVKKIVDHVQPDESIEMQELKPAGSSEVSAEASAAQS